MKYGKYLKNNQIEKWEPHYMDYKKLKKLVKDSLFQAEKIFTEATKVKFMPAVAEDLAKVLKFSLETKTSLRLQFEAIEAQGHHNSSSDLLAIHKELGFLIEFIKLNKEGFRKILKKYDKKLKSSTGFGVFKQVEARLASEAVDIAFIQENTLKFHVSKYGPIVRDLVSSQSEDVFIFDDESNPSSDVNELSNDSAAIVFNVDM